MEIDAKGGELTIAYDLENKKQDVELQVITAAEWIEVADKSVEGVVRLSVDANREENSRTAPVIVTYANQRFDVEVTQAAKQKHGAGFVLTSDENVAVQRAGGKVEVTYTIDNAIIGEDVSVKTNAEWVGVYDRMGYQKVVLSVALNEESVERSTVVEFYYGSDSFQVTLTQSGEGDIVFNAEMVHGYYYGEQYSIDSGNYWIILTDNGYDGSGTPYPLSTYYRLDVYGEIYEGKDTEVAVPVGTYTLDMANTGDAGTIADDSSSYFVTDAVGYNNGSKHYESAVLVVEEERMTLTTVIDGLEHTVIYEGQAKLLNVADERVVYTTLTDDYAADLSDHRIIYENYGDYYEFGYQNWMMQINPNSGNGDNFQFDMITIFRTAEEGFVCDYVGSDVLKAGSYIFGFLLDNHLSGSWFFTSDQEEMAPLRKGELKMTNNDDGTVTITINVQDELRNYITGEWVGEIPSAQSPAVARSIVVR